jgi:hypothetical protein
MKPPAAANIAQANILTIPWLFRNFSTGLVTEVVDPVGSKHMSVLEELMYDLTSLTNQQGRKFAWSKTFKAIDTSIYHTFSPDRLISKHSERD